MLNTILTLERPLIVFDLETTSLDIQVARIVEIAFQVFTAKGMIKEWSGYVNPGIAIPAESAESHHITDDMVKERPNFAQLATNLVKGFSNCDFAGKNVRYDLQVLSNEMIRAGIPWSYAGARIIDADRLEQIGEPRTLSHLYSKHTGKRLENAHSALPDVKATSELIFEQLKKYKEIPRTLDILHEAQWPGWVDAEGKFKRKNGVVICNFGKHRNTPIDQIPSGYWGWLTKSDFSEEIKQIAENALVGKFPV